MLINGISYSWGDISVQLVGVGPISPIIGITAIDYKEEQNMTNNPGAGNFPVSQGYGEFKYSGSIELYREELVSLQNIAALNKIQTFLPFSITVTYGNATQALTTDVLQSCIFMENIMSAKVNDTRLTTKINLLIGNIQWG